MSNVMYSERYVENRDEVSSHTLIFFNDTTTTEIYTLSLHDALPIFKTSSSVAFWVEEGSTRGGTGYSCSPLTRKGARLAADRKSTRLNSSHANISHAVFCLKKI